jgi:Excreted virulence factor EspC, type VII ESX diderm
LTETPLAVTAQYLRSLAALQNEARDGIGNATIAVNKAGENAATTHGSICSVTATAVKTAEDERFKAARLVQAQSADLAVKLEHAADKYDEIDREEKANLDEQMQPGG